MALKPVLLALWGCGVGALVAPPARRLGQRSAVGVVGDRRVRVGARVSSERRFGAAHSKRQTFARRRLIVEAAPVEAPSITPPVVYEVYAQRWLQLGMLSLLAFISDLVCFATAAVPQAFEQATGHEAASLIDVFLFSNVFACFCFTDMAKRFGLRDVLVGAGIVMSVGCLLRSGVAADHLPPYACVVAGTILVGLAQPFFQCSPPLLSATWFPKKERALATATALNANQLGIAAAFVVGGAVVHSGAELPRYFEGITAASVFVAAAVARGFQQRPPTPPSASAAVTAEQSILQEEAFAGSRALPELTYPATASLLLKTPGFAAPLAAFVASIGVTNVVSAFAGDALARSAPGASTAFVGAGFQVAIVLGGIALGSYVDATRQFKGATLLCLVTALGTVLLLGVAEGYDSMLPQTVVIGALFLLGASVGPMQPVNAELAVEVSHPTDENAVEATQQLAGNLFSALLVPLYQFASKFDVQFVPLTESGASAPRRFGFSSDVYTDMSVSDHPGVSGLLLPEPAFFGQVAHDVRGDTALLLLIVAAVTVFFANSNFVLLRSEFEEAEDERESKCEQTCDV